MQAPQPWGFGLRLQHAEELLSWPRLPYLELMVEHFAWQTGGPALQILEQIRGRGPLLLHGLHLNIGGMDPLDRSYLREIRRLLDHTRATVYSDHLCFSQWEGRPGFDLLPIPRSKKQLQHVIQRVESVQDILGHRLSLENISAYAGFPEDSIPECEFLQNIASETGCGILLDVNNLYVNAHNFGFDPWAALQSLDADSIVQYHGSGHRVNGSLLQDTHDQDMIEPVWQLLHAAVKRLGSHPMILERDDDDLALACLVDEWRSVHAGIL